MLDFLLEDIADFRLEEKLNSLSGSLGFRGRLYSRWSQPNAVKKLKADIYCEAMSLSEKRTNADDYCTYTERRRISRIARALLYSDRAPNNASRLAMLEESNIAMLEAPEVPECLGCDTRAILMSFKVRTANFLREEQTDSLESTSAGAKYILRNVDRYGFVAGSAYDDMKNSYFIHNHVGPLESASASVLENWDAAQTQFHDCVHPALKEIAARKPITKDRFKAVDHYLGSDLCRMRFGHCNALQRFFSERKQEVIQRTDEVPKTQIQTNR